LKMCRKTSPQQLKQHQRTRRQQTGFLNTRQACTSVSLVWNTWSGNHR
jgi:hypothetical protein